MSTKPYDLEIQEAKLFLKDNTFVEQFQTEVNEALELIKSGKTLTDDDLKKVKNAEKHVRQHVAKFKKAINSKAKEQINIYTQLANQIVEDVGYNKLFDFVQELKLIAEKERVQRINNKQTKTKEIIEKVKQNYPDIVNLKTNTDCLAYIIKLFPNLNSADKKKDIKNWEVIEDVINNLYRNLDDKLQTFDLSILKDLPLSSEFYTNIAVYFKNGDKELINNLTLTKQDQKLIKNKKIQKQLQTPKVVINHIEKILNTDLSDEEKLSKITKLIQYRNGQF